MVWGIAAGSDTPATIANSYVFIYLFVWVGLLVLAFLMRNDEESPGDRPTGRGAGRPLGQAVAGPHRRPPARGGAALRMEARPGQRMRVDVGDKTLCIADADMPVTIRLIDEESEAPRGPSRS
jgi:hypothetical protein